ncbi:serine/threonine kinase [Aureococcus anophagefferens]|nr:serine/threonine kinase [Aureococcus anophagefferens]
MEVLAGAGFAGVNGVVKAVTGKSILQHCGIAVNRLRANVLGIGAEYMGHALADKFADEAWKVAEAKLAGPDRDERRLFSRRLEALSDVLQSVASSPAVEGESVKKARQFALSLERAFNAAGSADGRRSSEADIDNYKQDLQLAFLEASQLGEGSFGATHTMRNIDDGQLYAVKLIKIKKAGVPIENLQQEASRLAKLHHPNIVRYYTSFKKKPFFAIVTELLTGGSLLERIDGAAGPLPAGQIKRWTIQIASALAHMHARRMQHRDLKPDNVLFDARGDARIIDLGLAQIVVAKSKVSSKNAVGAELYRSPEKALGSAYDAKDDIWALGCMVAGAATGKSLEDRSASGGPLRAQRDKVKSLVVGVEPSGDAPSENGPGKVRASATSAGSTATGHRPPPEAAAASRGDIGPLVTILAPAASRGDFGPLVAILRTGTDGAKEQAAVALEYLAVKNDNKVAIVKAGALDPLVALLRTGTDGAKEHAAVALEYLAVKNDNKVAIVKAGALDPLVALLRTGTDGAKEHAAGALTNLAINDNNEIAIVKAGAADPLVSLLRTGTDGAKEQAAGALWNLALNADNQIAIAKAGAVDPLVALLRTGTGAMKERAAGALKNLTRGAESRAAVAQALSLSATASESDVNAAVDKARS